MKYFFLISTLLFGPIFPSFSQETGNCTVCCSFDLDGYADCVDFEEYTEGPLVPQASPKFTLFLSFSEDANVTKFPSGTDNKCLFFEDKSDISYNIDRVLTEDVAARLEWKMNLSSGEGSYWALTTDDPLAPPLDIKMNSLQGEVFGVQNGVYLRLAEFDYTADVWTTFVIIFNPKMDFIELWVNGKFINRATNQISNEVKYLNFYGDGPPTTNGFYIDDICYRETNADIACTLEYNPVCVNDKTYVNGCFAYLDGYSECEYYGGECSSSTSETNQVAPVFYPNPSCTGRFYTQDQNITYTNLIDINGQSHKIVTDQNGLDLSHLPNGVYILSGIKDQSVFKVKLALVE